VADDSSRKPKVADVRETPSGIPVQTVYRPDDAHVDYARDLGDPGAFPYTRGV
jgi:methylmalonyl-CoA mutase N-terminal domain/subunit